MTILQLHFADLEHTNRIGVGILELGMRVRLKRMARITMIFEMRGKGAIQPNIQHQQATVNQQQETTITRRSRHLL